MCRDCAPAVTTSTKPNFTGPQKENGGVRRPVDYINEQLDDAIKQNIVEQYNVYATQVNRKSRLVCTRWRSSPDLIYGECDEDDAGQRKY